MAQKPTDNGWLVHLMIASFFATLTLFVLSIFSQAFLMAGIGGSLLYSVLTIIASIADRGSESKPTKEGIKYGLTIFITLVLTIIFSVLALIFHGRFIVLAAVFFFLQFVMYLFAPPKHKLFKEDDEESDE